MYTNLISSFLARRQVESTTGLPSDECLNYTQLEDAFIDLDTKITSKQSTIDNINYANSNTNNNITCHYCGQKGHMERDCRKKKRDQQGHGQQRRNSTQTATISQTKVIIINKAMERDTIRKRVLHVIFVARRDTM